MRSALLLLVASIGLALATGLLYSTKAACQGHCIPTPCGVDMDCDQIAGCRCFIPAGRGVGRCG